MCRVFALTDYLTLRGSEGEGGFLFRHIYASPLARHQFWAITSMSLDGIGLAGRHFCTHSFRIRAASVVSAMGYRE